MFKCKTCGKSFNPIKDNPQEYCSSSCMDAVPTMEYLREALGDWQDVETVKHLRGCLLHAARLMDRHGHTVIAESWRFRVTQMPDKMLKEAINAVLFAACVEVGLIA